MKPGPREQITENSGDGGERASVGIKRKETKEFLLKSRGWEDQGQSFCFVTRKNGGIYEQTDCCNRGASQCGKVHPV